MLNVASLVDRFYLGINQAMLIFKKWGQGTATDLTILVERRRQHCAAILLKPDGIVGAAA